MDNEIKTPFHDALVKEAEKYGVLNETSEGKFLAEVLGAFQKLEAFAVQLAERMDELEEDVDDLEAELYEEFEEIPDFDDCMHCDLKEKDPNDASFEDYLAPYLGEDDEFDLFELDCPHCGEKVYIEEDYIDDAARTAPCPNCGQIINFDIGGDDLGGGGCGGGGCDGCPGCG